MASVHAFKVQNQFVETWDPTIEDSYQKQVKIDKDVIQLDILDTAGQEEYKALRDEYMRNAHGFLLVFDVTSRKTYLELETFRKQIIRTKDCDFPPIVIAGNKCDLPDRQVPADEAEKKCAEWKVKYFETSAKSRKNVDETFEGVIREILRQHNEKLEKQKKANSTEEPKKKKGSGCTVL